MNKQNWAYIIFLIGFSIFLTGILAFVDEKRYSLPTAFSEYINIIFYAGLFVILPICIYLLLKTYTKWYCLACFLIALIGFFPCAVFIYLCIK